MKSTSLIIIASVSLFSGASYLASHIPPQQPEFTYMEWVTIKRGFYADTEGQILAECTGGYLVLFMGEISSCIPTKFIKATEISDGNG
jgi:hypothetical protein